MSAGIVVGARLVADRLRPGQDRLETTVQLLQGERYGEHGARSRVHGGGENLDAPAAGEQDDRGERMGAGDLLRDGQSGDAPESLVHEDAGRAAGAQGLAQAVGGVHGHDLAEAFRLRDGGGDLDADLFVVGQHVLCH